LYSSNVFNVCCCSIAGLFNVSRLITSPNPGTNVFPLGVEAGKVFVVVSLDAEGDAAFTDVSAGICGGSGTGAGGGGAANGPAGFIGLDMLVGFVALFWQVF
jgi:hypothetical protein